MYKVNDTVAIKVMGQVAAATIIKVKKRLWWNVYTLMFSVDVMDRDKKVYSETHYATRRESQILGTAKRKE